MLKRVTFSGGVRIADRRYAAKSATVTMKAPELVKIKLTDKHNPIVKAGQKIKIGQLVAESLDEYTVCQLFSPVSGQVADIITDTDMFGAKADFIEIINDGLDITHDDIIPFNLSIKELQREDIINIITVFGIPDTDGKPIGAKLKTASENGVKALVVGTGDSEGYNSADERLLYEHPDRVVNGIKLLMYALQIRSSIIAVEEDKLGAVNRLEDEIDDPEMINVRLMKAKYPQCIGRNLVSALFDEEIPYGQSLAQNGYVTLSAQTAEDIFLAFYHGMPFTSRRVTVCGEGVFKPRNIIVPVGTAVKDIIGYCDGLKKNCGSVIAGGAMRGKTIINVEAPLESNITAVIAIGKRQQADYTEKSFHCINCGRCVDVCPSAIKPNYILSASKSGDINACFQLGIMKCNNCGCCSYVCPEQLPISGMIADTVVKNREALEECVGNGNSDKGEGKSILNCIIEKIKTSPKTNKDD